MAPYLILLFPHMHQTPMSGLHHPDLILTAHLVGDGAHE